MKRFHVHVAVDDLSRSIGFYSTLFAAEPVVLKEDYAKWMLDDPRVNFAISTRAGMPGVDHLGIQVESGDELGELAGRLKAAGEVTRDQEATICCYARSDKAWVNDPSGVRWETFHTFGEATHYGEDEPGAARAACCRGDAVTRDRPFNVLFLCTGNSARSILAEAITNQIGHGRFNGFSAGSTPKGAVHPQALALLQSKGLDVSGFRSKPWDEFAAPGAPPMDFVITVCDDAAGEDCPVWPGRPITAHWGMSDPAAVEGEPAVIALAFAETYRMLMNRLRLFTDLPVESLDRLAIQRGLDEIGRTAPQPG